MGTTQNQFADHYLKAFQDLDHQLEEKWLAGDITADTRGVELRQGGRWPS